MGVSLRYVCSFVGVDPTSVASYEGWVGGNTVADDVAGATTLLAQRKPAARPLVFASV